MAIFPPKQNLTAPPANAYQKLYAYDGSNNLIYEGWALPGAASSDAKWAICKYTYSGSNQTGGQWANGSTEEVNIWDNRASLTYL